MQSDNDEEVAASETEHVGYANPPKATRFKKGQSGNKKGRPKGAKGRRGVVERVLLEKQTINERGTERTCTSLDLIILTLRNLAFAGDARAFKAIAALESLFAEKPPEWVGGVHVLPEPLTLEEYIAKYKPKLADSKGEISG